MLDEKHVHPDEGTIHTWLDGALDAPGDARMEAHVAGCSDCAVRVADARGLVAAASRIVGLLDDHRPPLVTPANTPTAGTERSVWRRLRVTPARAAIAAALIVSVGIALSRGPLALDQTPITRMDARAVAPERVDAAASAGSEPAPHDSVLSSAIARRLAAEEPPRTIAAAPGVAIPAAPAESPVDAAADVGRSESKVLAARASMRAQRDSTGVRPDQTIAGMGQQAVGAAVAAQRVRVAASAADSAGRQGRSMRAMGALPGVAQGECYRVESTKSAMWGSVRLPMIVAFDSLGPDVRVFTASGAGTETRAFVQHNGADSVVLRLRRIGYSGSMTFSADGATRAGVIRSTPERAESPAVVSNSAAETPVTACV